MENTFASDQPKPNHPKTNHLNTFQLLYLIKGILNLLMMLFFAIYAAVGGAMFFKEFDVEPGQDFFNPGYVFITIGLIGIIISLAFGIVNMLTSKYIKEHRKYDFIFVVAIINCLTGVLGILLGVFTIIELNKPEVKELFCKE